MSDTEIKIESSREEVNAWVRNGYAWRGKVRFYYKFAWAEGEGYEIISIDPEGTGTEEERAEFFRWYQEQEDLGQVLDDLTYEIA